MFHDIPEPIVKRMRELEAVDRRDRGDGTERLRRLRQIPAETGRFLALTAAGTPSGAWIEIGTSAGYSSLWLSLACRAAGRVLTTFEVLPEKASLARETFRTTATDRLVTLVEGDARRLLGSYAEIAFCFLDAEKDVYADCYDLIVPRMVPGGMLVADNVESHREELASFIERALHDPRVDAVVVPIGKGELVCRKI